ncbi:MAG: RagB/SusD family nutrient uptake outer membrane protein [Longimicrobiales bacterium]|nr:RagB/SusD family nutrient uptake outer membrane protein [Longimicrobiales bacterium]
MRWKTSQWRQGLLKPAALLAVLSTAACGELFDVTNPGRILDADLEDANMVPTVVTGMSADFSVALGGVAVASALMSDEIEGSGNNVWERQYSRGIAAPEFDLVYWATVQRARWVAESGIDRIKRLLGENVQGNVNLARAYLFAGLSNRVLGENFCKVIFDGGPLVPRDSAFHRGMTHFTDAIRHAAASGNQALLLAAYGGRAQVHVGAGDWAAAVADAQRVPTDFVYEAVFSANSGRENNDVWETSGWLGAGISAVATLPASLDPQDPRAPWTRCVKGAGCAQVIGGDGVTPLLRQDKYRERGSKIPVVKGTEMRLIEAEALLRDGDVAGAMAKMNQVRARWQLAPLSAADRDKAWAHLYNERLLTLWLEGRRLHDLHRWNHPFLHGGYLYHVGAPERASCWGVGLNECQTNPNSPCP